MTRETGELIKWDDQRGFGFIRRPGNPDNLYVHAKSLRQIGVRPKVGDKLSFEVAPAGKDRIAATHVEILNVENAETKRNPAAMSARITAAATLIALLSSNMATGRLSIWVGLIYIAAGIWSYALYLRDKEAAGRDSWRTPEKRLHYHDLAFGIIGGLIGQQIFRHKTSKPGFGVRTAIIVAVHVMVLGLILAGVFHPAELISGLLPSI